MTEQQVGAINPSRRGVALILMVMCILVVAGFVGLAIDGGIMYMLKARLSQAVDAGALAGARSLSRGADVSTQAQSATTTATNFFKSNFPNGYWGATVPAPTVVVTEDNTYKSRSVSVTSTVTAPLYFLRLLGQTTANLSATAQATRRDVNIMLVIDRSSSMAANGAIAPTITAAQSFVNLFAPGRDIMGMVVFGGDYSLYAPTTNFGSTSSTPLVGEIAKITSSGNTNTATALWAAYSALAGLNQPGALNVIVFFTDGLPNGITANMVSTGPTGGPYTDYRVKPATCDPTNKPLTGYFAQWSGFANQDSGTVVGLMNYLTPGNAVSDPNDDTTISNGSGCSFYQNGQSTFSTDFTQLPSYDINGTPTWDVPGKASYLGAAYSHGGATVLTSADLINHRNNPYYVGVVSSNAADFVAQRWRHGDINGIVPLVFGITLTEATGEAPDPLFMLRVSNSPSGLDNNGNTLANPIYSTSYPQGTYVNTSQQGQLQSLFLSVGAQILHLSI